MATRDWRSAVADRNGGTAVLPGSYDPVTLGHLDIITRAANVFENVVVGVVNQPVRKKKTVFTADERVGVPACRGRETGQCAGKTL